MLRKTIDESWPEGFQLLEQENIKCDGYRVLYRLLERVTPRLNDEVNLLLEPTFERQENLYTYCNKYMHYIGYQADNGNSIQPQTAFHSVIARLEKRTDKFSAGVRECRSIFREYQKDLDRHRAGATNQEPVFPRSLRLEELATTITKYAGTQAQGNVNAMIGDDDFEIEDDIPDDWFNCYDSAHVLRTPQRQRLDETCKACGTYGHNIKTDGSCDMTAIIFRALRWIKTSTPEERKTLLQKHSAHQKQRQALSKNAKTKVRKGKIKRSTGINEQDENAFNDMFHLDDIDNSSTSTYEDEIPDGK